MTFVRSSALHISILSFVISTCWIHVHFLGLFPDRSYVLQRSAEDMNDDANMYADIELIEDYPMKPATTMFDILKRVLAQKTAPAPEPTELIKTPFR